MAKRIISKTVILFSIILIFLFPVREVILATARDVVATVVIRPVMDMSNLLLSPFSYIVRRVQFFWQIEPLYFELHSAYDQLLKQHIMLVGSSVHAHECDLFDVRYDGDYRFTRVIMQELDKRGFHRCIIDAGALAGVKADLPLVSNLSIIGKVIFVMPLYSVVQMISDIRTRIPVRIGKSGARGIFEGTGDLRYGRILYVSHLDTVYRGDIAVTAGDGCQFPEGFGIARVVDIHKTGFTYTIDAEILAPLGRLERATVFIDGSVPTVEMVPNRVP